MSGLGLNLPSSLILCSLTSGLPVNYLLITIYRKQEGFTNGLVLGYNDKSSELSLELCPLSRIIVVSSLLGPITHLAILSGPHNSFRYGFQLVMQTLDLIKNTWLPL